jgi:hypothetical protein
MRKYCDDGKHRPRDFDGLTRFVLPSEKEKVIFGIPFFSLYLMCVRARVCACVCMHAWMPRWRLNASTDFIHVQNSRVYLMQVGSR